MTHDQICMTVGIAIGVLTTNFKMDFLSRLGLSVMYAGYFATGVMLANLILS